MSLIVSESHVLYHGDCHVLLSEIIAEHDVRMVLTDPPYGSTQARWDTELQLDVAWSGLKGLAPEVPVLLFAQTPFDKVLGASNIRQLRYEWIWEKTAATGFLNAKKMPLRAHENVLVFYRRLPLYNPQMTSGHVRKVSKAETRGHKDPELYGLSSNERPDGYDSTDRYPRSVLRFAKDNRLGNSHPTQKPVALLEYLIRTYTNPGDVVLDFTMGRGRLVWQHCRVAGGLSVWS